MLSVMPVTTAYATAFTAPEVPSTGEYYMPEDTESFADGLWYVIRSGIAAIRPDIKQCCSVCLCIIAIIILIAMVGNAYDSIASVTELVGVIAISTTLLSSTGSLLKLGAETVTELSVYGKSLLPVMTATVAAQGGTSTSAVLYTGTVFFNALDRKSTRLNSSHD